MIAIRNSLRLSKHKLQFAALFIAIFFISSLVHLAHRETELHESFSHFRHYHWDLSHIGVKKYPKVRNIESWDWNNYDFMEKEKQRQGPGEQGKGVKLTDHDEIKRDYQLTLEEGLHVVISDKISVNRSVKDTRPKVWVGCLLSQSFPHFHLSCFHKKYLKELPVASIIIIFYNEWPSVLLRTVHSVYNRSPRELVKEIILVDDNSTKAELKGLEKYVQENFDDRVKVVRLKERKGLIVTRMEGARQATGEVLVFLDSHMEVNRSGTLSTSSTLIWIAFAFHCSNWLPPLLEPIAKYPTTVTTPTIDSLYRETFVNFRISLVYLFFSAWHHSGLSTGNWRDHEECLTNSCGSTGSRCDPKTKLLIGPTRWQLFRLQNHFDNILTSKIPIMLGAAFAIRRDFFFDLGGYDEGLLIWNGEQIELSLKLHLCGGDLVEVPCSRINHVFRYTHKNHRYWRLESSNLLVELFNKFELFQTWRYRRCSEELQTSRGSVDGRVQGGGF